MLLFSDDPGLNLGLNNFSSSATELVYFSVLQSSMA
jgi:hypothetical protein